MQKHKLKKSTMYGKLRNEEFVIFCFMNVYSVASYK